MTAARTDTNTLPQLGKSKLHVGLSWFSAEVAKGKRSENGADAKD
jgi:hypothetical protein